MILHSLLKSATYLLYILSICIKSGMQNLVTEVNRHPLVDSNNAGQVTYVLGYIRSTTLLHWMRDHSPSTSFTVAIPTGEILGMSSLHQRLIYENPVCFSLEQLGLLALVEMFI